MEEKLIERDVMSEKEFSEYLASKSKLWNFEGVAKFRSIKRAMKRGLVTPYGVIAPKRPFNNRANTSKRKDVHSRVNNELKKDLYGQYKRFIAK